eukprot:13555084-Ditylum_brightwellii.AAC.1
MLYGAVDLLVLVGWRLRLRHPRREMEQMVYCGQGTGTSTGEMLEKVVRGSFDGLGLWCGLEMSEGAGAFVGARA